MTCTRWTMTYANLRTIGITTCYKTSLCIDLFNLGWIHLPRIVIYRQRSNKSRPADRSPELVLWRLTATGWQPSGKCRQEFPALPYSTFILGRCITSLTIPQSPLSIINRKEVWRHKIFCGFLWIFSQDSRALCYHRNFTLSLAFAGNGQMVQRQTTSTTVKFAPTFLNFDRLNGRDPSFSSGSRPQDRIRFLCLKDFQSMCN